MAATLSPASINSIAAGNGIVTIQWGRGNITPTSILRSDTQNGSYVELALFSTGASGTFIDSSVVNGQTYWYKARSGDPFDSDPVLATPIDSIRSVSAIQAQQALAYPVSNETESHEVFRLIQAAQTKGLNSIEYKTPSEALRTALNAGGYTVTTLNGMSIRISW